MNKDCEEYHITSLSIICARPATSCRPHPTNSPTEHTYNTTQQSVNASVSAQHCIHASSQSTITQQLAAKQSSKRSKLNNKYKNNNRRQKTAAQADSVRVVSGAEEPQRKIGATTKWWAVRQTQVAEVQV